MTDALAIADTAGALAFVQNPDAAALQSVLAEGNIAVLTAPQRLQFLAAICRSIGLNPLTSPFEFISLNGKLRIYAKKDATEQLRKLHNVSLEIVEREWKNDLYIVRVRASMPSGRQDESIGAVSVKNKKDEDLANALAKAETKAKRRVTLSICGLGFMDESEVEGAKHQPRESAPSDPFAALPAPAQEETWQSLYPHAWGDRETPDGITYGEIADYPDGEGAMRALWRDDRNNPVLCAWAAQWIEKTIARIPDCEFAECCGKLAVIPDAITDLAAADLPKVAQEVLRIRAAWEKGGAE